MTTTEMRRHVGTSGDHVTMLLHPAWLVRLIHRPGRWARRVLKPGAAVVLDVETTDFDGAIIELAVIDAATGSVLLETLVDPGNVAISEAAYAVHRITSAELEGAPRWPEVYDDLSAVVATRRILAYNAEFDYGRIMFECKRYGTSAGPAFARSRWDCVMIRRSQSEGVRHLFRLGGNHRARGDAKAALDVVRAIAQGCPTVSRPLEQAGVGGE